MASQQHDAVFDLDDDDRSSQSHDDLEDDPEIMDDDDDDEEEDLRPLSPSTSNSPALPLAVPSASAVTIAAVPNGQHPILALPTAAISPQEPKRLRIGPPPYVAVVLPSPPQLDRKPLPLDETRRLFQRLWTDEDEIELLQGFLEYSAGQRGPHPDTALFYDQIKSKLQLDFNKNQLVEKLRRLKKKYRTVAGKIASGKEFSFKSPHDQATFEISQKIWSSSLAAPDDEDGDVKLLEYLPNHHQHGRSLPFSATPTSKKRSRSGGRQSSNSPALTPLTPAVPPLGVKIEGANLVGNNDNSNCNNNVSIRSSSGGVGGGNVITGANVIEETVRSCLSPFVKELVSGAVLGAAPSSSGMFGGGRGTGGIGGLMMNAMPLGLGFGGVDLGALVDEKWRKQQILELEVYSKRLELVQDQIRVQLDELRSMGGKGGG